MKVFKFGGASVKDAEGVKNLNLIINRYPKEKLVVVVSAMGKMTNALENVVLSYYRNEKQKIVFLNQVKAYHDHILSELFQNKYHPVYLEVGQLFDELSAYLSEDPGGTYDFEYDQIVSFGELFSTKIIFHYLKSMGVADDFFDAREVIFTDDTYREGKVYWPQTVRMIKQKLKDFCIVGTNPGIVITQGFIGKAPDGATTTLGREGSDYTAAIFGHALQAEEVIIWKDVPGLLNADPKFFPKAVKIKEISYKETIELAYYGASVIHPKTIQPLENKGIPLQIRSFLNPAAKGTLVHETNHLIKQKPAFIFKKNQVLLSISPNDFSFIAEKNLQMIFGVFAEMNIRINLMQNSAISFSVCIDDPGDKMQFLLEELNLNFKVKFNKELELLTIRHYNQRLANRIIGNREILLEQRNRSVLQVVIR